MECSTHHEREAVFFCSNCGLPLCLECKNTLESRIFCQKCLEALTETSGHTNPNSLQAGTRASGKSPETRETPPILSRPAQGEDHYCPPGVVLALGFIPGVGAIANGEYGKGLLQVLIFGSLLALGNGAGGEDSIPFFKLVTFVMYLYMPLEAYHVARKRTAASHGVTLITPFERFRFSSLGVGITTLCLGVFFQLSVFVPGAMRFLLRGWPLILVAIGVYNLSQYARKE
ncbi:MAG: B-box zinc finger protein [Terriglobia bacterium]